MLNKEKQKYMLGYPTHVEASRLMWLLQKGQRLEDPQTNQLYTVRQVVKSLQVGITPTIVLQGVPSENSI